ncbi:MAG: hypothetical protein A2516_02655 [Alphaproteobacteria bacterium RIFOXYD12_FULL_60_8]|nr:MAG: hypothetical protein A2516_02655 [Alphaproteobacteria bacterium RIFOXYD12_FULL_60_8]
MTDIGFSSSAAGAAYVAASSAARPQAQVDIANSTAVAARNIADNVALSAEALMSTAVMAAEQSGDQGAKSLKSSPESQSAQQASESVANLAQRIEVGLNKMSADVNSLMRMFGLSGQEASEVQQKFVDRVSEKIGQPPEASLGMRAYVPYVGGTQVLEAQKINIDITMAESNFSVQVDFQSMDVVPTQTALSNAFATSPAPMFTTPEGNSVVVSEGSAGVVLDANGQGTREIASVLTGRTQAFNREGASQDGTRTPLEEQRRREALGIPSTTPAEKQLGGAGNAIDANQDGVADQTDSGFQSLIAVRTGSAVPTVEGGTLRVAFDAIIPLEQRHDPVNVYVADQATRPSSNRVTEVPAHGFDVKA